jgi:hypothetical protein
MDEQRSDAEPVETDGAMPDGAMPDEVMPEGGREIGERTREGDLSARIEALLSRVRANPGDADVYAELVDLHARSGLADRSADIADVKYFWSRESELAAARAEAADALFQSPGELGRLAGKRPEVMADLDGDRIWAGEGAAPDPARTAALAGMRRVDGDWQVVHAPDADGADMSDPVRAFGVADAQYRSLLKTPVQYDAETGAPVTGPADVAMLRAQRLTLAREIVQDPARAVELGMESPELVETALGLAGRAEVLDGGARGRAGKLLAEYGQLDARVAEAGRSADWQGREEAVKARSTFEAGLSDDPAALMLAGREMARTDDPSVRIGGLDGGRIARLTGGVAAARLAESDPNAAELGYEEFRARFAEQAGGDGQDPVELYARANEALLASDRANETAGVQSRHLERLSHELAGDIFQSGAHVGTLAQAHPALLAKASLEAASLRQGRDKSAEGEVAEVAAEVAPADRMGSASAVEQAADQVAERRPEAEQTPAAQGLRERYWAGVVMDRRELSDFFNQRTADGRLERRDLSQTDKHLALPLNGFGGASGAITKELSACSGEELQRLYANTKKMRQEVDLKARTNWRARQLAHDKLEMGRRALAFALVGRGLARGEDLAQDAHAFQSKEARRMDPWMERDPGGAIKEGDLSRRARVLNGAKKAGDAAKEAGKQGMMRAGGSVKRLADDAFNAVLE